MFFLSLCFIIKRACVDQEERRNILSEFRCFSTVHGIGSRGLVVAPTIIQLWCMNFKIICTLDLSHYRWELMLFLGMLSNFIIIIILNTMTIAASRFGWIMLLS